MDWWRDLEPGIRWLAVAAALGAWIVVLAAVSRLARPRRVEPDATVVDPPGPEPAALAATLTNHWSLDRDAVPATVLDLAARGHVSIRSLNGQVMVYVSGHRAPRPRVDRPGDGGEALTAYERLVLDRLHRRARLSRDGSVPAQALAHGKRGSARRFWRRFRKAVYRDAVQRGLARRRWPAWAIVTTIVLSLATGFVFGTTLAASALDQPTTTDGSMLGAGCFYGACAATGLLVAVFRRPRLRDTAEGRTAAARWLGFRSTLAGDPYVASMDGDGVSTFGRRLAYAAAMGLAPRAIEAFASLHRGSKRVMWSPVSGTWREVRVRYPRFIGTGYGLHPGGTLALGVMFCVMALVFAVPFFAVGFDGSGLGMIFVLMILIPVGIIGLPAVTMLGRGIRGLTTPRTVVEGYVLRIHSKMEGERSKAWYVVVDDGLSDVLRPWKLRFEPTFTVNARVRAELAPAVGHVRNIEVVDDGVPRSGDEPGSVPAAASGAWPTGPAYEQPDRPPTQPEAPAPTTPDGLPTAETVSRIARRTVEPVTDGVGDDGTTVAFKVGNTSRIQVTRLDRRTFDRMRPRWRRDRKHVAGVGDEAYRKFFGGMLLVRHGDDAVMVHTFMPDEQGDANRIQEALARLVLALPTAGEGHEPPVMTERR